MFYWQPSGTADWFNPGSWSPAGPPAAGEDAYIENGGTAVVGNIGTMAVAGGLNLGDGSVLVENGASGSSTGITVDNGSFTVTGTASSWTDSGQFWLYGTSASATVSGGAVLSTVVDTSSGADTYIDFGGSLTVTGTGTQWVNPGAVSIYTGSITLDAGAVANTGDVGVAATPFSDNTGLVTVSNGARWNMGNLSIGSTGTGTMLVESGGSGSSTSLAVDNGSFTVTGDGSSWTTAENFSIDGSQSSATVSGGAVLATASDTTSGAGISIDQGGFLTVTGTGTQWINPGSVSVDTGSITIQDGAVASTGDVLLNPYSGNGSFVIDGAKWTMGSMTMGYEYEGTGNWSALVENGGSGTSTNLYIYAGTMTVTGTGSSWTDSENFWLNGQSGSDSFIVSDGAVLNTVMDTTSGAYTNLDAGASLVITGTGSTWNNPGGIIVFTGSITLENGAVANTPGYVSIGATPYGNLGLITVSSGAEWNMGYLTLGDMYASPGTSGTGTMIVESGGSGTSTTLEVDDGTFMVTGTVSSWTNTGYFYLSESGSVGLASVVVSDGAVLDTATNSGAEADFDYGGYITVTGTSSIWNNPGEVYLYSASMTLQNDAVANTGGVEVAESSNNNALVTVSSGAQWNVAGLVIGPGTGTVIVDTAGTLNVADGTGDISISSKSTLEIGSGGLAGTVDAGLITNSGTIKANFTDTTTLGASISGSGKLNKLGTGTLIITGADSSTGTHTVTAGTLQIGNGGTSGAVSANISDSGTVTFDHSNSLTYSATISGAGGVAQIGTGTTILTGTNTYTGATTITAGTLQLGNGSTKGSIANTSVVDNGTLAFDRSNALTYSGTISGTGGVEQIGSGTTVLTGTNTYTGATTITQGTLQIGNGISGGGIAGNILDSGTLVFDFNSEALTYGGTISGSGKVQQIGTGTTILTGANTYTGATTITAGTLQIGNGTARGAVAGNISSSGTLVFDFNGGALTYGGTISGAGKVWQIGTGTTILTGANTYTGTTTITAGTLQLGNGSTTGSITGNVNDGGTLAFDRSNAMTYSGTIRGTGAVAQTGNGTTTLTGTNSYSGGTSINSGTLVAGNSSALGTGSVNVSAGTLFLQGNGTHISGGVTLSGGNYNVAVASGASLANIANATSQFGDGENTRASILSGTASSSVIIMTSFSATSNAANDAVRQSDVYSFNEGSGNTFVLELSSADVGADSILGYLGSDGTWDNAVLGNTGLSTDTFINGGFNPSTDNVLGYYGMDSVNGDVWAVLNTPGTFAITTTAVPEPPSRNLVISFFLLVLGFQFWRKRGAS